MNSPTRALQSNGEGQPELASIVKALSEEFSVVTDAKRLLRRRRLDTFDRRLHESGLTLEHQSQASTGRLVLARTDGTSTVVIPVNELRWPAAADTLPSGPVRDAVAPVAGIRALMVTSDERRRIRQIQVRNEDGKTVVRIELDEPASRGGPSAQLLVRRLRGYDEEARRAEHLLAGAGLRPVEPDTDGMGAPVEQHSDTGPESPATALLGSALKDFLGAMDENLSGLLEDVDTEFLHDFRVAVRRTRSTLKLGRPALPEVMRREWEPAFKWLGDLTTPVRDLDVYELELPTMSRWLVKADPEDLHPLAIHLRGRRTVERRALVRALRSAKFRRLVTDWDQALARLTLLPHVALPEDAVAGEIPQEHLSAGELAERSIARAYRRVAGGGGAIEAYSPAAELHDLRKRCKELRYALEVFAPVVDKKARKTAVDDLKGLQDALGRFQDTEVERQALREFAEEMMAEGTTAAALLAMGELIGHLDVEQEGARRQFDASFAWFQRPASRERMHRLGGRL